MKKLILIRGPPESSRTELRKDYHGNWASTIQECTPFRAKYALFSKPPRNGNLDAFCFPITDNFMHIQ